MLVLRGCTQRTILLGEDDDDVEADAASGRAIVEAALASGLMIAVSGRKDRAFGRDSRKQGSVELAGPEIPTYRTRRKSGVASPRRRRHVAATYAFRRKKPFRRAARSPSSGDTIDDVAPSTERERFSPHWPSDKSYSRPGFRQ